MSELGLWIECSVEVQMDVDILLVSQVKIQNTSQNNK